MSSKTAARPSARTSHSHSHSHSHSNSQSKRTHSKTTTPADHAVKRISASVGQSMPPSLPTFLRTPAAIQEEVRTPSPNYFGLIPDPTTDPKDSHAGLRTNWSPPTSSIQSFGAGTPQHLPLDANPEFAAFRRQTEGNISFKLGHGNLSHFASTPSAHSTTRERRPASRVNSSMDPPSPRSKPTRERSEAGHMELDGQRKAMSPRMSSGEPSFFDIPRQQSPVSMGANQLPNPPLERNFSSRLDDRHPRLSLPQNRADPPSPQLNQHGNPPQRADTLPPALEDGPTFIPPSQLKDLLDRLPQAQILLLDLRVFPQFSASRIKDALSLCIPTTLLKRPSFNLKKLQETFTTEAEKTKFSSWTSVRYIVVYDAFSDEKKDAVSALNTLKKFTNEGWAGQSYILRGGFQAFSKDFPKLVDNRSSQDMQSSKINLSLGPGPEVAPVAGGCAMPTTKSAANPFFSNIRQNQDLIGGVGRMDIKMPEDLTVEAKNILPQWLLQASARSNRGQEVSDKFLKLEKAEQARMQKALASGVTYGTPREDSKDVQIAGIEKGSKNRYNNIWPFEHARVKLQGKGEACDYVNASHVKAARSNKHYIASQGPLPATFEDFWSVIWDHDVRVIVMLTAESEGGQLKCHSYWNGREYGSLKLKPLSEKKVALDTRFHRTNSKDGHEIGRRRANTGAEIKGPTLSPAAETPHAIVRKFSLAHSAHPFSPMREITQIHYSSWPDFGAPASPAQLLGLVELCNSVSRSALAPTESTRSDDPEPNDHSRPVLVHCSAGCGRTGTFCTIDSVIDMLKRQRKEIHSGATPMEGVSSDGGDYLVKGKSGEDDTDGDWVLKQDMDLVEKTVEDFRQQRLSMVQSLRQYVLCYETVLEWIAQQRFGGNGVKERRSS